MNATAHPASTPSPVRLFRGRLSIATRVFLEARWRLTPYAIMAERLPAQGRILDLGCGHGLLALAAALASPARQVIGIDHDAGRVRLAAAAARGLSNVEFRTGAMTAPPPGPFAGLAMIDVLHYFTPRQQEALASQAHGLLAPGGTLLVREVDPDSGPVSAWNRLYERVATGIGLTRSAGERLHFRSRADWSTLLDDRGFDVAAERCSHPLFADVLYVCTRR